MYPTAKYIIYRVIQKHDSVKKYCFEHFKGVDPLPPAQT